MRIFLRIVGVIWFLVMLLITIIFAVSDSLSHTERVIIPIISICFGALGLVLTLKYGKSKFKTARRKLSQSEQGLIQTQTDLVSRGELTVISNTSIISKQNELIHFALPANRLIMQNKAVGRTGGGAGMSLRVAKGISVHSGRGNSRTIYRDVTTTFSGMLFFTNQRIIFINTQQGFEINLDKLTSINEAGSNLLLQSGNKSYLLATKANRLCIDTVRLIISKKNGTA